MSATSSKRTRGKTRDGHVTKKELAAVDAWAGNDTEACRAAGYSSPSKAATTVFRKPAVMALIERKKQKMVDESAKRTVRSFPKSDAIERALKLSDTPTKETNGSIQGQVAALRLASEMAGHIVKKTEDLTKQLEGKTEEEKEFFAANGYWPPAKVQDPSSSGKPN